MSTQSFHETGKLHESRPWVQLKLMMYLVFLSQNPVQQESIHRSFNCRLVINNHVGSRGLHLHQIAVHAFTPMVTLEGIFLWTNHPYHEAQGLVRKRVGHWIILRAVVTPVPDSKSNPIRSPPKTAMKESLDKIVL